MMHDVVIRCRNVGKKFCKSLQKSMQYGALDIMQSFLGGVGDSTRLRPDEFWAVHDVSFDLKKGETLGIIGPNGSGKTTLLRMLNGIFMPDAGSIAIEGRVGGLIQVGAGFHPMLSGRENIYINATILGMSRLEIDQKFDSIVDFADIGDFLDAPVKHYSSGMLIRLGFAVAVHCQPDIILIDEILSVGDIKFQSKCVKFLTEHLLKKGCTVIFVSHNRYAVEDLCQQVLYLNRGRKMVLGKTKEVMAQYLEDMKEQPLQPGAAPSTQKAQPLITNVEFLDEEGRIKTQFHAGQKACIRIHYRFNDPVVRPSVGLTFLYADARYSLVSSTDYLFNVHSGYDGFTPDQLQGEGFFELTIEAFYLPVGVYKYMTYLFADNHLNLIEKNEQAGGVEILWTPTSTKRSLIDLPHRWALQSGSNA